MIACIGGGSNAIGSFEEYLDEDGVKLIGVEAGGKDIKTLGEHAARISSGQARSGIYEGTKSMLIFEENGQIAGTKGISAGLDYAGIGPIHAYLNSIGRVMMKAASDVETVEAFQTLAKTEGILGALESCHAVAECIKIAPKMNQDEIIIVNLSGRADNYVFNIAKGTQDKEFEKFCNDYKL